MLYLRKVRPLELISVHQKYVNNVTTRIVTKKSIFLSLVTLTLTNITDLTERVCVYKQFKNNLNLMFMFLGQRSDLEETVTDNIKRSDCGNHQTAPLLLVKVIERC